MRGLFFRYINGNHIIWLRSTSSNTQVIRNYGPQSRGTAGALIFWLQVSGMTLYLQRICPAFAWLQIKGAHNFFCLYAPVICEQPQLRGMSRTLTLCLQFPIVTTILWGQLAGKPWQFSLAVSYYTAQQCLSRSIKPLRFLCIVETT